MKEKTDKEKISEAMSLLGSRTSPAKKAAAILNGKKGGRPILKNNAKR